ncbi:HAD family hydrolase [Streptomyces rhizosphaerihabitans]
MIRPFLPASVSPDGYPSRYRARRSVVLAGRGWDIVLAASASGTELAALRCAIGADDVIIGAAGADDVDDGKPAPAPVEQARQLVGVPCERAVFGGDAVRDMKAAERDDLVGSFVSTGCRRKHEKWGRPERLRAAPLLIWRCAQARRFW